MRKSKKKYSIYTTELKYNRKANNSKTIYHLIGETDNVDEVDELYKIAFKSEMEYYQSIGSNFKSYYTICALFTTEDCKDDLYYHYDYGSYSRFIEVHFKDEKSLADYTKLQKKKQAEYEAKEEEETYKRLKEAGEI